MAIIKPPVLPAWADTAANPADIVQPTNPEISAGWPLSSTPPARQRWNWVLNYCMNAVRYLSRRGLVDYDAEETYVIGDMVRGDDGLMYRSLANANINHTPSSSAAQWGSPLVPTATADDSTTKAASTAYVLGQLSVTLPGMDAVAAVGTSKKFARADHVHPSDSTKANINGSYAGMSVGFATSANAVPFSGITGKPTTVGGYGILDAITTANIGLQSVAFAASAGRAFPRRSDGSPIDIVYSGQGGQPNWLLGTNDGATFFVYNPANFSVNFANSASAGTTQPAGTSNTTLATTAFVNRGFSHGATGYEVLPSGLVLQWGSVTFGDLASGQYRQQISVTFPVSFPNQCSVITFGKVGDGTLGVPGARYTNVAGTLIYMEETNGQPQGSNNTVTWMAIGF